MMTVYGRDSSVNVQAVMWCVAELGRAHERLDVGGKFGGNDTPEFKAMNPMGLVPVLRDGDAVLWETPTILRYLMRRYGGHPADPLAAARIEIWADWSRSHLYPHIISTIFYQLYRTPAAQRNFGGIAAAEQALDAAMTILASNMRGPFLGGDTLTLADFQIGALMHRYFVVDFKRNPPAAIADYYAALSARPAYRKHVMIDPAALKIPGA